MTTRSTRQPTQREFGAHWLAYLGGVAPDERELLRQAATSARRAGCTLFELACSPVNNLTARDTAWALKKAKMKCVSYCRFNPGDGSFGNPLRDARARARALATLSGDLQFIGQLKDHGIEVPYITGPSFYGLSKKYDEPKAKLLDKLVAFGDDVGAMLAGTGVTFCPEYLRPSEDYVLESMDTTCGVIDRIGNPAIGLHADISHMLERGEVPHDVLEMGGSRIKYLRAHGSKRQCPGVYRLDDDPEATDNVNWHQVACALNAINYRGPVVPRPMGQPIRDLVEDLGKGLPKAIDPGRYYTMARAHLMHHGII
jgi:sugar phosphate isomerase/epimerase